MKSLVDHIRQYNWILEVNSAFYTERFVESGEFIFEKPLERSYLA